MQVFGALIVMLRQQESRENPEKASRGGLECLFSRGCGTFSEHEIVALRQLLLTLSFSLASPRRPTTAALLKAERVVADHTVAASESDSPLQEGNNSMMRFKSLTKA